MSNLPAPASSLPRASNLDDVEADAARYRCLHGLTRPLAKQALLRQLRELSAESGAALLLDPVQQLHELLNAAEDAAAGEALPALDGDAWAELKASLAEHLALTGTSPGDADGALAEELAEEFSQSLWSTLLDHGWHARQKGKFNVGSLLPEWPRAGRSSGLLAALAQDLSHFGLPERALLEITHGVARRLPGSLLARQGVIGLPLGLDVPVAELQRFLEEQAAKGSQRPRPVRRPVAPVSPVARPSASLRLAAPPAKARKAAR